MMGKFALYPFFREQQQEVIKMNQQTARYQDLVLTALFAGIIVLLAFTPIGFINLVLIKATIIHVPVIIGSILLGAKRGSILGFCFGLTSFISNYTAPSLLSFAFCPLIPVPGTVRGSFWALVICFIPRILVGIVPYYVYRLMQRLLRNGKKGEYLSLVLAGVLGAATNTVLVMGLISLLFKDAFATARNIPVNAVSDAVLGIVAANGIPEAIAAALITVAVCRPLLLLRRKSNPA